MDAATARSLVEHINKNSTQIYAYTMAFGERTWVILHDTRAPHTVPCEQPILEADQFLERLKRRCPENAELRCLIEDWLKIRMKSNADTPASPWPVAPGTSAPGKQPLPPALA